MLSGTAVAYEFEVGEAAVHDTVVWVKDTPVKCGKFSLPGKKALLENTEIDIVLVDVTESPIERPKKTASAVFRKKEAAHSKNPVNS